jgi:serine/threonine protein kinase/tetratricopeptide (TPR) repeat protein
MSLAPGARLGPYEIVAPLGRGGMGVVYQAIDPRLKRTVAIKLLPTDLTENETARQRFIQEARAASALDHPNICTIYEINEYGAGKLYLVMALYAGETLKQKIAKGPMAPDRAIEISAQIGEGLGNAHARGIVHRDIKPANLLVLADGSVKILDFGLAKLSGSDGPTQTGVAVGTTAYMSPEQLRGEEVDHRTDIWSLGVVMYEMLAGRRPFDGSTVFALADAIERQEPEGLATMALGDVIAKALHKDRDQRYAVVRTFVDDLRRRHGGSEETTQTSVTTTGGGASIAVLPFSNTSADPENDFFADGISEEIINTLGQIAGLRVAGRGSSFFFKGQHVDPRDIGRRLRVDTVLEGSVRRSGSRLRITAQLVDTRTGYQLWSERYDRELQDIFDVQDDIARTIADRLQISLTGIARKPPSARATGNVNAYEAYLKGRSLLYKRGRFIPQAIGYFEEAVALDPDYALSWAGVADGKTAMAHYGLSTSGALLVEAKAAALKAVNLDGTLAEARCALAMTTLLHDFDLQGAHREFRHAMQLNQRYPQAVAWYCLWVLAFVEGRCEEAVALMRPVVEQDPLFGYNHRVLAQVLALNGQHEEAVAEALASINLEPDAFMSYWTLLMAYGLAGRHAEAFAAGHSAMAISGRHPFVVMIMAAIHAECGMTQDARRLHDELTTRAETEWISPALWASVAASAGLPDRAVELTAQAHAARDPQLLSMLFALPQAEPLRRILADAGRLDEFRHPIVLRAGDDDLPTT